MLSGEQLKFLRYYNGKTQQQVADWCNVSRRYIIMVEQNEKDYQRKHIMLLSTASMALESHCQKSQDQIRPVKRRSQVMSNGTVQ